MLRWLVPAVAFLAASVPAQIAWSDRSSPPPTRTAPAACYDASTGRTVLFGGFAGTYLAETWFWDGAGWSQAVPAVSPPPRSFAGMVHDQARRQVLLYGGLDPAPRGDTWLFDGTNWTQPGGILSPPARSGPGMCYDPLRQRVVLFGGWDGAVRRNDTWEWNGSLWLQRTPTTSPPGRSGGSLTWDPYRQRVILFGGRSQSAFLNDTWEWNGVDWAARPTTNNPIPRAFHDAWFDERLQRLFVYGGENFGGVLSDWFGLGWWTNDWGGFAAGNMPGPRSQGTAVWDKARGRAVLLHGAVGAQNVWEYVGAPTNDWIQRAPPAARPSVRLDHDMAHDSVRGRTVLFGGRDNWILGQTWEWDGSTWLQRTPPTTPSDRFGHSMCFARDRGRTVLFGGITAGGRDGQTWEWDGNDWSIRAIGGPAPRAGQTMTFDTARNRVVLFGGFDAAINPLGDTWEWDGATWLRRATVGPPARGENSLCYDEVRRRTVLFGGYASSTFNDTWEWDGSVWQQRFPANSPSPRYSPAAVFDEGRGRVVVHGGHVQLSVLASMSTDETWEWTGETWLQRTIPTTRPRERESGAMVYDRRRGRCMMFGGVRIPDVGQLTYFNDTWELVAPMDQAGPVGGSSVALEVWSAPYFGGQIDVRFASPQGLAAIFLDFAPRNTVATVLPAPLACQTALMYPAPGLSVTLIGDPARFTVALNLPVVLGQSLLMQGLTLSPTNCLLATNALVATIQHP